MTQVNATLTFSLPEDQDSNLIHIYASPAKEGVFEEVLTTDYDYGETELELTLDDAFWYKLQFENQDNSQLGPISEPVFGGSVNNASPFLAVGTRTDGANYATSQDLYDYSGLTPEDVESHKVSVALRRARAVIDFRTAEMDFNRFDAFDATTARRKYNASLRILKEAEINIALGNIYTNLSDDIIIESMRGEAPSSGGSVSIGGATIGGDSLGERNENILYLAALADKYYVIGERLLSSLDTNSVRLVPNELTVRSPRFRYPFNGY